MSHYSQLKWGRMKNDTVFFFQIPETLFIVFIFFHCLGKIQNKMKSKQ